MADTSLYDELERRVEEIGFELVELERAGNQKRPILRLRIDRPDSASESGVTLEDCTRVSRALEPHLDERGDLSSTYLLEVSSPGVERPLIRRRDFERFAGKDVALRGKNTLAGRAKRLEGVLVGLAGAGEEERVVIRLADGEEVEVPRAEVRQAHLVYRWE